VQVKKFKVKKALLTCTVGIRDVCSPSVFVVSLLILDKPVLLFPVLENYMENQ
jgi:hypothetical protein